MNIDGVEHDIAAIFAEAASALPKIAAPLELIIKLIPADKGATLQRLIDAAQALATAAPSIQQHIAGIETDLQPFLAAIEGTEAVAQPAA